LYPSVVYNITVYGKQAAVYYYTVPFCSHLVQNPVEEVVVQTEVEAMLNFAEKTKELSAKISKILLIFISFFNLYKNEFDY
jgi:hypothetical protein